MQTDFVALAAEISGHAACAYEKLRSDGLLVSTLSVSLNTNRFRSDLPQYANRLQFKLMHPTDDLRIITQIAKQCLNKIYKPGFSYKKIGICFDELVRKNHQQLDLFNQPTDESLRKKDQLMTAFDSINQKFGRKTIKLAAEGFNQPALMLQQRLSPRYTTQWSDLPIIKNGT